MYGAPSTIGRLWYNQSAAVLGNIVGGAIFIGLAAHLMNHWKTPFTSHDKEGTLLGHDAEATKRAVDTTQRTITRTSCDTCATVDGTPRMV